MRAHDIGLASSLLVVGVLWAREQLGPRPVGQSGTPGAGPYMTVYLKTDGRTISEAWFETYSCPVAMACGSWLTAWVQGLTHEQARLLETSGLGGSIPDGAFAPPSFLRKQESRRESLGSR